MNQKTEPINIKTSEVSHKKPIRKILTGFVTLLSTLLFTVIIGVYIPKIPYIGEVGTALVTYFVLQFLLLSLIVGGLAYLSWRLGGKRMAVIAIVLSIVNIIGYTIPFVSLLNTAKENGVNISLSRSLTGEMEVGGPELHKSVKFASLDGTDLYMDITKPENWEGKSSLTPVVLIHGGGFVSGTPTC